MKPMPPDLPVSEEDWNQTPAAVQALLLTLWQQVAELQAEVAQLREQVGRNSQNSSQPPSSDPPNAPPHPPPTPPPPKPPPPPPPPPRPPPRPPPPTRPGPRRGASRADSRATRGTGGSCCPWSRSRAWWNSSRPHVRRVGPCCWAKTPIRSGSR